MSDRQLRQTQGGESTFVVAVCGAKDNPECSFLEFWEGVVVSDVQEGVE